MEVSFPVFISGEMDPMQQVHSTQEGMHQSDMTLGNTTFEFEEEESAALFLAFHGELCEGPEFDTGLPNSNISEQPTTVVPLATLIVNDHISDSTTCDSVSNDSASESKESATGQYTPPTPVCDSPSPGPALDTPPAPAHVNKHDELQEPRDPSTPMMVNILAQNIHEEWVRLNDFSSTALPSPADLLMDDRRVEPPFELAMYHPIHFHGHTPMLRPIDFGQFYPHLMFFTPMGYPPTYPVPRPVPQLPPVSNKRSFQFVDPEIPQNFVANPNNHGRWQYDRQGNRHYLNAPKRSRTD